MARWVASGGHAERGSVSRGLACAGRVCEYRLMGKTRGRVAFARETYEKLIASYRAEPGAISKAAAASGCAWELAKRAWSGPRWAQYPWAIPAQELFEEERAIAMARAQEDTRRRAVEEERRRAAQFDAAREEQIEALRQENLILKGARGDVLQALALAADLAPAMKELGRVIKDACKPDPVTGVAKVGLKDAMSLLGRHALIMQRAVAAASTVLDQGKVTRGEPTAILGLRPVKGPSNYDDAISELEEAGELLERYRQLGTTPRVLPAHGEAVQESAPKGDSQARPRGAGGQLERP